MPTIHIYVDEYYPYYGISESVANRVTIEVTDEWMKKYDDALEQFTQMQDELAHLESQQTK